MSRILLISDNPLGVSQRGCESNDRIICDNLNCDFATCEEFNAKPRTSYDKIIVSNFYFLSDESKWLLKGKNYETVNHDFLFHPSRIPSLFPNFICPKEELINISFFKNSRKNWCQSSFQANIFKNNGFEAESWEGNLWSQEDIDSMVALNGPKNGKAAIIAGYHKGEEASVDLAKKLNVPFDILPQMPYKEFLVELSKYSLYLFVPNILESFGRILVEAKVFNTIPLTTNLCGAVYTSLWNYSGGELAAQLHLKREEILNKLKEV